MIGPVDFICTGCGMQITTYRWVNYRTIPPSMDERDMCNRCKELNLHPIAGHNVGSGNDHARVDRTLLPRGKRGIIGE